MALDGTLLDVPDSQANAPVFGYPGSRKGTRAAFPKVRVVLLIEAGTHLIIDALMCPYRIGERIRALKLLRSVERVTGVNHNTVIRWVMTRIEGENTRLRHYLARLNRKTLCYSKSAEMLRLSIRLLLHYLHYDTVPV